MRAFRDAGLAIVDCTEVDVDDAMIAGHLAHAFVPDAVRQAYDGLPFLLIWHLEVAP